MSSADVTVGRADGAMLSLRVIGACGPLGVAGIVACAVADVVNVPASGPVVTSMCTLLDPPAGSSKGEVHRSVPSRVDGSFVVSPLVDPGVWMKSGGSSTASSPTFTGVVVFGFVTVTV